MVSLIASIPSSLLMNPSYPYKLFVHHQGFYRGDLTPTSDYLDVNFDDDTNLWKDYSWFRVNGPCYLHLNLKGIDSIEVVLQAAQLPAGTQPALPVPEQSTDWGQSFFEEGSSCSHEFREYIGLKEKYYYCIHCDQKVVIDG